MVINRRSEIEIIHQILTTTQHGAKTTEILYKSYLNYNQLQKYIPFLIEKQLITEKPNGKTKLYITTIKGINFQKDIKKTLSYIK